MRLLPAQFYGKIKCTKYERYMKIASRCAPWKRAHCFAAAAVLEHGRRPQTPRKDRHVITELVMVLWRVNLTLALYRSLLNKK